MKNEKKTPEKNSTVKKNVLENLNPQIRYAIVFLMIAILVFYFLNPYITENAVPFGEDTMANVAETNLYVEWQKTNNETVLWNPAVFGGLPVYARLAPKVLQIDIVLDFLSTIVHWSFWYFLAGGLGIFFFMQYKKLPWYVSVLLAMVFVIFPDWQSLLGAGHNTKIRAIMIVPFFLLSFNYLFDKRNLLGAGLFTLVFSWFIRTQHYQIVFYGIMLAFIVFIWPFIKMVIQKQYKEITKLITFFAVAAILTIITSAQPFFAAKEYAEYSTRGGNSVNADQNTNSGTKGVDLDYATGWSLAPAELMDLFIARFHGGYSNEIYDGNKYPDLKGKAVPGYWGDKPFNGNYSFIGGILFLLALIGLLKYRKDAFVISLGVFIFIATLLSFGKHFLDFYKLFYEFVPFFSKFRIPSMVLNVSIPALLILSGFGLKYLLTEYSAKDNKLLYGIFGGGFLLALLLFFIKDSFAYTIAEEAGRYDANTIALIKDIRKEFLSADLLRLIILLAGASGLIFLYTKQKFSAKLLSFGLFILFFIEVAAVASMAKEKINVINFDRLRADVFHDTEITNYLSKQDKTARLITVGNGFTSNHYAFYYPIINGYSAIKLQIIQDVIESNLYNANTPEKINWNLINMLNGKFVVANGRIPSEFLEIKAMDQDKKEILFENKNALPKAWFIKAVKKFDKPLELVNFMNSLEFRPDSLALTTLDYSGKENYSGVGEIKLDKFSPNKIELSTKSDSEQFLVLSEIFYPKGWKAFVNGKETSIIKTNHILRGINIPSGNNKIEYVFEPETYSTAVTVSWSGSIITLLIVAFGLYFVKKESAPTVH